MNKAALLQALSAEADALGALAPGEAKFESWIQKELIPKADAIGKRRGQNPDWIYPTEALLAAKAILRLEAQGAIRVSQIRIGLALEGFASDPGLLRADIASEFDRWAKRERRQKWRNFRDIKGLTDANKISDRDKARLSELDPELDTAALSLKPLALLRGIFLALFGTSDTNLGPGRNDQGPFKDIGALKKHVSGPSFSVLTRAVADVIPLLWGLLGIPDETDLAAKQRILKTGDQQVVAAVLWYRNLLTWLEHPEPFTRADFSRLFGVSSERLAMTLAHFSWQPQMLGFILVADIAKLLPIHFTPEISAQNGSQS